MNPRLAIKIMLWIEAIVISFHICIILKVVPYEITWGGRLKNDMQMYVFEFISLIINMFLVLILLEKGKYIKLLIPNKLVDMALWLFAILFGLNTIGNIFAETNFEKFFGVLTAVFSFLIWIIITRTEKDI